LKNNKAFSAIEIIMAITIVAILALLGWVYYNSQNKTSTQQSTSTQTTTQTDPNEGYFVVKEWGLRFKVPAGLTDVNFSIHDNTLAFFAKPTGFDVEYVNSYNEFYKDKFTHAAGVLHRTTDSYVMVMGEKKDCKKVGNFYYYTSWSFAAAATGVGPNFIYGDNKAGLDAEYTVFNLINNGDTALLNTIEASK
jgi:prepilin-type N-terminal cleavage/methylation domain-containing protein